MTGSRLDTVIERLRATKWPAELFDAEWNLVWVSDELKAAVGNDDDHELGVGSHIHSARSRPTWASFITDESKRTWVASVTPYVMATTPGGREAVLAMAPDDLRDAFAAVEPEAPPSVWSWEFRVADSERELPSVGALGQTLRDDDGIVGFLLVYGPALPSGLLTLLTAGDQDMFRRMARLADPQPADAAILFADLEASAALSRRLPSSAFFAFICALNTAIDEEVVARRGIVGKHAGDGTIAFFLAGDAGGPAQAAAAAVEVACAIPDAARRAAREAEDLLEPGEEAVNVGVHWGASLYMGQVVTRGRLEVTALGDEVNECARIQQAASGGAIFASKGVLERLDERAAAALHVDRDRVRYTALGELDGVDEKVRRDAAALSVVDLSAR
jgi:class 3 adenylate cyclase